MEAAEWIDLGPVDPFTSVVHSPAQLFLARALRGVPAAREATEIIEQVTVTMAEAVRMVMDGRVTHGPTCVLVLKAHLFLSEGRGHAS